jgi:hypothetical protein
MHDMVDVITVGVTAGVAVAIVTCVVGGAWLARWVVAVVRRGQVRRRFEGAREPAGTIDT